PPFYRGDVNFQILNEKPEPIKHISEEFNNIIMKCLKKDYKQRFSCFEEVENGLINKNNSTTYGKVVNERKNKISTSLFEIVLKDIEDTQK
ncbi:MAG: hypothetical protein M0Q94_10555, partial [Candidatus Cloacimonetes bacterium]|nr:hypothetical protein [Candidatus Cloacimonadota bacterium]